MTTSTLHRHQRAVHATELAAVAVAFQSGLAGLLAHAVLSGHRLEEREPATSLRQP
ncbi:MAG: hypothetical protein JWM62_235 [Frankiales bacterium]|nr:hypothetical protein [Frankiales bacterium]